MQYTQLGRSGLKVSRLILGTMNIGWTTPADEGKLLLDRGLELGINVIGACCGSTPEHIAAMRPIVLA